MTSMLRPLSREQAQALGVDTKRPQATAGKIVRGQTISGEVTAPAFEVSDVFDYQSYFSNALAERAIREQPTNQPIVPSTKSKPIDLAGYGIALHPSSETPVAVQMSTGAQQGASPTYRLKPGQLIRPQGRRGENGQFTGFTWGLPFGWLGGGSATLVVLRTAEATVDWAQEQAEVIYHRIRLPIYDAAGGELAALITGGLYSGPLNWPQRFPWPGAKFGTSSIAQGGQPALAVTPTKTAMSLRLATVGTPSMRINYVGSDPWAQDATGLTSLADVRGEDYTWGTWAQQVGAPAPFNSVFEEDILTDALMQYPCNPGAVVLTTVDATLIGQYVDFVRYGKL